MSNKLGKNPLNKKAVNPAQEEVVPQTTLFKEVVKPVTSLEKLKEMRIEVDWNEMASGIWGRLSRLLLVLLGIVCLSACQSTKYETENMELKKQLVELQKIQAKQRNQIDELGNRILLLSDKVDSKNTVSRKPDNEPAVLAQPEQKPGDLKIYERAMQDLKENSFDSFKKNTELLSKNFKNSPLTNNAMFLLGEGFYKRGDYTTAAQTFEKLYSTNPDGNRAVSTLYYLGLSYQKLGRGQEAREAYQSIVNIYPGSREAKASAQRLSMLMKGQKN